MAITNEYNISSKEERRKRLMSELKDGVIKRDILLNSSYRFPGEVATNYFSQTEVFMHSSLAKMIMHNHKDCSEVNFLRQLGESEL